MSLGQAGPTQSMCRPADRHTDQGQSSQIGVVRAGRAVKAGGGRAAAGGGGGVAGVLWFRHGPSDQMEAVGFTAASGLIQAHRPADKKTSRDGVAVSAALTASVRSS